MKYHFGQWAKDFSFASVACSNQGHGKSTSPDNMITCRDAFFFLSATEPDNTCLFCLRELTKKTPKRAARIIASAKDGKTLDEIRIDTARLKKSNN